MEILYANDGNVDHRTNKLYIDDIVFEEYGVGCHNSCKDCVPDNVNNPNMCFSCVEEIKNDI